MSDTSNIKPVSKNKLAAALALFLPGIFLLGFNLGTGSVTAMAKAGACLLYTSPSPRDKRQSRMPSSA